MLKINMKKREIFVFVLIVVLLSSFAIAQSSNSSTTNKEDSESKKINNAYDCLKEQIKNNKEIALKDAIFGVLAVGSNDILLKKIEEEKKSDRDCWPKADCKIRESAQMLLAYDRISKDTSKIKDWLLSKEIGIKDLIWYFEIDLQGNAASECNIKYDSLDHKIKIGSDRKIKGTSSGPGPCFKIAYNEYWLRLEGSCIDKEFEISCTDSDFISALVYQKKGGSTVYVTSKTKLTSAGASVTEKIDAKCLSTGSSCDYEGTLWAAIALEGIEEDGIKYVPYLLAMSEDNSKFLPEAFLYMLGQTDSYNKIIEKQKGGKYWEMVGTPNNKFYDTSVALLAIGGTGYDQEAAAKNYLLSVQTKEGCWNGNNIRDTAFVLYSAWKKGISVPPRDETSCAEAGKFCEFSDACLDAGGIATDEICSGTRKCCSKRVEESCEEKKGITCASDEECNGGKGGNAPSSDGNCCLGICTKKVVENSCEISGGNCDTNCGDDEEEDEDVNCLNIREICCVEKKEDPTPSPDGNKTWIYILIFGILILLVIIAIVYRTKIQMWMYKRKEKGREGAAIQRGPPRGPPRGQGGYAMPQQRYPIRQPIQSQPMRGPIARGAKSSTDKEMEETMKKLKEMSE